MHIKRITTHRWKGRSLAVELAPACVITGPSFSGKTSLPMAIRLALAGYLPPPIGKQPGSIWQLASNPDQPGECSVALQLDDGSEKGRVCGVVLTRNAKGKVSMTGNVPADIALPSLLVEPSGFFAMTAAQRTQAIFAACDKGKIGNVADKLGERLACIEALPSAIAGEYIAKAQATVSLQWTQTDEDPVTLLATLRDTFDHEAKTAKQTAEFKANELAGLRSQSGDKPKFDQAEFNRLDGELSALRSATPSSEARDRAVGAALAAEAACEATQDAMVSAEHELNNITELDCCPTCHAKTKGWKAAIEKAAKDAFASAKTEHTAAQATFSAAMILAQKEREALAVALKAHDDKVNAVMAPLALLRETRGALAQWEKVQNRRADVERELIRVTVAAEVWKQAKKIVDEVQSEAVNKAVGNVVDIANNVGGKLLNSPLEFVDGVLGRRVSQRDIEAGADATVGAWISHEGFSGTEVLLSYAALAVALSQSAPFKLVVMDELGRIDTLKRRQLLEAMKVLVMSKVIDQFVGIMATSELNRSLQVMTL